MSQNLLNTTNIPLSLAVWLAVDNYEEHPENTISATGLLKPIRQTILKSRLPKDTQDDVVNLLASRMGTAIHDAIENAWVNHYKKGLARLGYPQKIIDRITVNPTEVTDDIIPVYVEIRTNKKVGKYTISGQFDFVAEGTLEDFKSTSTFTYMSGSKTEDYILQGSIYRWLNPDIITSDRMKIQMIFTDWNKAEAMRNKSYPQSRTIQLDLDLKPIAYIDSFIKNKISEIEKYTNSPESELPLCSDKDLWRTDPIWKYYASGTVTPRSTKNFSSAAEANLHRAKAGKGIVVEHPGEVKACKYCPAAILCSQKDAYLANGTLKL